MHPSELGRACRSGRPAASPGLERGRRSLYNRREPSMFILHVHIKVKPEHIEEFKQVTIANASNSVKEPGVARFDFIQQDDDPTRFMLIEVYHSEDAIAKHRAS